MSIVYTAGTWDCFHFGHLNLIKKASELGNKLIVGVSTDELVLEYKKHYPIIPFKERFEIIKSLKYVDEVVKQEKRDKLAALNHFKFNIWAIGDDWHGNDYYMEISKKFKTRGIETAWIKYTKGISSTIIREKLNNRFKKDSMD